MICEECGNIKEDCECKEEEYDSRFPDECGDDESIYGYDGDAL